MKNILVLFFFIPFCFSAQSIEDIDQLTFSICKTLNQPGHKKSDSARLQDAFNENLPKFTAQFKLDNYSEDLMSKIFLRLQRNCDEYKRIDYRLYPDELKGDWKLLDIKPISKISASECNLYFKKHKKFYYFEAGGDKTYVNIGKGFWIDTFKDGTTSKLYFKKNDCKFELTFIESNNDLRKNFSVKGNQYFYEVISVENEILTVIVQSDVSKSFSQFKLYPLE